MQPQYFSSLFLLPKRCVLIELLTAEVTLKVEKMLMFSQGSGNLSYLLMRDISKSKHMPEKAF